MMAMTDTVQPEAFFQGGALLIDICLEPHAGNLLSFRF